MITKFKYYNSSLKIGFNAIREGVFCFNTNKWLKPKEHKGRLVFGNQRIPYLRIKKGIDKRNFTNINYTPF